MHNFVKIFILLSFVGAVYGQSNRVDGVWVVDADSTLEFNLKQKAYSSVAVALMKCMAKSSSLTFANGHMEYAMASHQCEANGKSSRIEGYETKVSYRVLASSPVSVAIATKAKDGEESFDVLHFENGNKFWLYSPGEPPEYEDHMRLFYVRKQK
jgi:hypothetical protein